MSTIQNYVDAPVRLWVGCPPSNLFSFFGLFVVSFNVDAFSMSSIHLHRIGLLRSVSSNIAVLNSYVMNRHIMFWKKTSPLLLVIKRKTLKQYIMRKTVDFNSNVCFAEDHEFESRSPLEITCNKIAINNNESKKNYKII